MLPVICRRLFRRFCQLLAICTLLYLFPILVLFAFYMIEEGEFIHAIFSCLALLILARGTIVICLKTGMLHLKYVPKWLRTAWACRLVVESNSDSFGLGDVINGRALQYVPESLRTAELCLAAVKQHGDALEYVPESLHTAELYLAVVKQNGRALEDVPEYLRTADLCLAAVKRSGYALEYVPRSLRTVEVCLAAGEALEFVPRPLRAKVLAKIKEQTPAGKSSNRGFAYTAFDMSSRIALRAEKAQASMHAIILVPKIDLN